MSGSGDTATFTNIHVSFFLFMSFIVWLFFVCFVHVHISIYLSIYLSIYPSIYLSIYLSNYVSIYVSMYLGMNIICRCGGMYCTHVFMHLVPSKRWSHLTAPFEKATNGDHHPVDNEQKPQNPLVVVCLSCLQFNILRTGLGYHQALLLSRDASLHINPSSSHLPW